MSLPAEISVSFDFSQGATFGFTGFIIGDPVNGVIGTSQFAATAVPEPVIDLSAQTRQIKINRGRNIMRDTYEAGTCTVRVIDQNGDFNPQNPASPYFGYLTPLRKIRVAATTATAQEFLFSGYVTDYKYTYPTGQELGYVDIACSDAFRLFAMANLSTVASATAGQTTGTRIGKILDQVDFPSTMRVIDTGSTTVQADPGTTRTSLSAIQVAEFTEQGAFFVLPNGEVEFKDRADVVASLAPAPIEFNQTTGIPSLDKKVRMTIGMLVGIVAAPGVGKTSLSIQILNTMFAVQNRLYESLRRGDLFSDNFMVDGNATVEPFAERTALLTNFTPDMTKEQYHNRQAYQCHNHPQKYNQYLF